MRPTIYYAQPLGIRTLSGVLYPTASEESYKLLHSFFDSLAEGQLVVFPSKSAGYKCGVGSIQSPRRVKRTPRKTLQSPRRVKRTPRKTLQIPRRVKRTPRGALQIPRRVKRTPRGALQIPRRVKRTPR